MLKWSTVQEGTFYCHEPPLLVRYCACCRRVWFTELLPNISQEFHNLPAAFSFAETLVVPDRRERRPPEDESLEVVPNEFPP